MLFQQCAGIGIDILFTPKQTLVKDPPFACVLLFVHRWDGQAAAELKAKRDKILSELGKLDTQSGRRGADHDEASELGTKAAQLKTKEQYMLKDLKVTAEKVAGLRKACEEVKKQASHCALEVKKVQPQLAEREASISKVQNSIKLKEDSTFSSFSRSIGVASIREFEEGQLKTLQEAALGRRDIREQKAKLEAQLQVGFIFL